LLQGDVTRFIVERAILEPGGTSERKLLAAAGEGIRGNFKEAREAIEQHCGPLASLESQSRYQWIRPRIEGAITGGKLGSTWTDWLDQLLTGRWTGLLLFALLMLGVFQLVFTVSKPLMEVCESAQGWISEQIVAVLPQGVLQSLLVNGVIAGVGSVLIFVPQIAFLFLVIGILEDCGYMARAAFLSDRLMSIFGLSGKSFLPLFSSFGCAVPGIMAARVIENRWERIVTILIAPLMSCSARLPVYVLLIAAMVPATTVVGGWIQLQALVLFSMYLVGVLVALPTAWVMRRLFFAGESAPFILELPEYKVPDYRVVLGRVVDSVRDFVTNAGTFIFAATILIWAAAYWPGDHSQAEALQRQLGALEDQDSPEGIVLAESLHREESKLIENSYLGRLGKSIEPIVRPMGWDWKLGVGALASFPAREVIVATLGTIYSLGGDVDEEHPGLIEALRSARWPDGRPVYTTAVALSVMVFFALCAQCASTLAIMRRETQSYRWPIFSFIYMTTLAYVAAIATYQLAS
jgi:ferrous iron transport protein B